MKDSNGEPAPAIITVNPRHKRLVAWMLLGMLGVGVVLHLTLRPYIENRIAVYEEEIPTKSREELARDYKYLTLLLSTSLGLPVVFLGTVFLYQAYCVYQSGQYPYPGMIILRDTPLETGYRARRRGRQLLLVGGMVIIGGCVLSGFLHTTLMRVLSSGNT